MRRRIRLQPAVNRCAHGLQEGPLRFAAVCLLAFCVLLASSCPVAAEESRQSDEPPDNTLDLSEDETVHEELPTRNRLILEIPLPIFNGEEKRPERGKQPGEPIPPTASESELRQIVRQIQQDLEMLKEEIAQLRSEFRFLMPKDSEEGAVTKRTVNPFWITDMQLEQQEQG